jgi:hypothetical protein
MQCQPLVRAAEWACSSGEWRRRATRPSSGNSTGRPRMHAAHRARPATYARPVSTVIVPTRQAGYHPAQFLTRHPSSAYAREANCSDCHNAAQFCQSCHQQSGLVATSKLGKTGYHDVFRNFSLGHGQAARQSLESCVACHAERDCTTCHSAVNGGFRFSPHGPGFNADRMRSKNASLCTACHGNSIPKGR